MEKNCIEKKLKHLLLSMGADVCGIASVDRFKEAPVGFSPTDIFKDCKSVISFGIALPQGVFEANTKLIYGHYNEMTCQMVDRIAFLISREIEERFGGTAVPLPCDAPNEYWEPETLTAKGVLSMKHTAVLCGIGQIGKNSMLLNPQFGNRLTVGAILTNLELASDELCESICIPGCRKCEEACPVHAIAEQQVSQKLCRPNTYGKTARGFDTVLCNRCREVCPMKFGK
ncbi:MAG TPA: epoxyqueuosine reductase [Lachnospiraceae bacterium]|nr:epoxyqueuosine reductase [Lachnospiraceae bacterium]